MTRWRSDVVWALATVFIWSQLEVVVEEVQGPVLVWYGTMALLLVFMWRWRSWRSEP